MSELPGVQGDPVNDRSSLDPATRKARRTRFYLPFPPGFDLMNEADQRGVCRAMAEETQRLLGVTPQRVLY
jgi:hypothetical protein